MIKGSGGANTTANTIAFNFSKAIKDGSFTVDDIGIANGTIASNICKGICCNRNSNIRMLST
jgi:hypothetical protein